RSGEPLEKMDVNLPPGIVRLHPLRLQANLLVHLNPALKVGNGSWVGSHDFELVTGGHALDLLLRLHDRHRALQSSDIELLHVHPVPLGQGLARRGALIASNSPFARQILGHWPIAGSRRGPRVRSAAAATPPRGVIERENIGPSRGSE